MYARTGSGNVPFPVLSNTDKRKKKADHEVVYGIWKTQPGKIMEFYQRFETLWINFSRCISRIHNTCLCTFYCACTFFPNLFLSYILWLISTWINVMLYLSFLIHIFSVLVSWKNRNIPGKIMEFDSGIRLETLPHHGESLIVLKKNHGILFWDLTRNPVVFNFCQ